MDKRCSALYLFTRLKSKPMFASEDLVPSTPPTKALSRILLFDCQYNSSSFKLLGDMNERSLRGLLDQ
jgi:hypothetical protein